LGRENSRQTKSLGRLVGPMRRRRACACVLRIGTCWSEQGCRRSPTTNTADRQIYQEDLLHCERRIAHPPTLRTGRCNSDHSWRDGYFRPPQRAI